MTIPETTLSAWSNPGAQTTAQTTHTSIRNTLKNSALLARRDFDTYLQGSYRNSTNTRGNSDVDIVVELNSAFRASQRLLTGQERRAYEAAFPDAVYGWSEFRSDVLWVLDYYYGGLVTSGRKAIRVEPGASGRVPADVVVTLPYRLYYKFNSSADQGYVEGMTFRISDENRWVVNYPKLHYANGARKQSSTADRYKARVRMIKNARRRATELGLLSRGAAPSYYVECLMYNVPDDQFHLSLELTYLNVVVFLFSALNRPEDFTQQNGLIKLFGPEPEQWNVAQARELRDALWALWERGG